MRATAGDWIIEKAVTAGGHRRRGLVVEVHGVDGAPPYRVRWTDTGLENVYVPGPGAHVVPAKAHDDADQDRPPGRVAQTARAGFTQTARLAQRFSGRSRGRR